MIVYIVDIVNRYSGLMLALITGIYAYLTYRILRSNKELIEAQLRPYITIGVRRRLDCYLCLVIENIGKSAARNVRLEIDKDITIHDGETKIRQLPLFKDGLKCFPSEVEYSFNLGLYQEFFTKSGANEKPTEFNINCAYSFSGKQVTEETVIEIQPLFKTAALPEDVADEVHALKEEVKKLGEKMLEQMAGVSSNLQPLEELRERDKNG